jgi:hypothetical protein
VESCDGYLPFVLSVLGLPFAFPDAVEEILKNDKIRCQIEKTARRAKAGVPRILR